MNVDRTPAVAQRYGVSAIPTVLIIRSSKEVKRLVGLQSETEYITLLDNLVDTGKD